MAADNISIPHSSTYAHSCNFALLTSGFPNWDFGFRRPPHRDCHDENVGTAALGCPAIPSRVAAAENSPGRQSGVDRKKTNSALPKAVAGERSSQATKNVPAQAKKELRDAYLEVAPPPPEELRSITAPTLVV